MSQYTKYSMAGGGSPSWKSPVATAAALPAVGNTLGDARTAQDTGILYVWDGAVWVPQSGGAFVGPANAVAGFDGVGALQGIPSLSINTVSNGLDLQVTEQPNNGGGGQDISRDIVNFDPLQNSPNESWNARSIYANLDLNSSGFSLGTNGNALTLLNLNISHLGTGNVGGLALESRNFNLGNGTDPIDVKGVSYAYGFGSVNSGVTLSGPLQGYGFQPVLSLGAVVDPTTYVSGFYDALNSSVALPSYTSFSASPTILSINNNNAYQAFNANPNITSLTGSASVNIFSAAGNIGTINSGSYNGVNISPTVALNKGFANGIVVNMANVTNYAGVAASLVEQDLTFTFNTSGAYNNSYTMEFADTVTAGNETVSIVGFAITVNMESGVSTATQIKAACDANLSFLANITTTISGVGGNPQNAAGPTSFAGGIDPGVKRAADFTGDVNINGALSFSGALNMGQFSSYASLTLSSGTGVPASIDQLITSPTVSAAATLTNADTLCINTAMLLSVGAGASVSTSFLGISALGMPAVVSMGAGSSVDRVDGAVFAISLDPSAAGGTIANVELCRALALPNGVTTVTKLKGFAFDLPFGDPGTTTWGIHVSPASAHNFMAGDLKVGSGAEVPANSSVGIELESTTKAILLSRMTTVQRNALTAVAGMLIFNTDTSKFQGYDGAVWADLN